MLTFRVNLIKQWISARGILPTKATYFFKGRSFHIHAYCEQVNKITVANFENLHMSDRKIMCDIQLSKTFNECIEWLREAQVS